MASLYPTTSVLPAPQTFVYKTVHGIDIEADVYYPSTSFQVAPCPVFLYIHGGGWISGSRKDVNGPMVHELLARGVIVTSIDYRLLPEVSIEDQFDDIASAEGWARNDIHEKAKTAGFRIATDKVLVGGGSAGAHLAMMVPHIWRAPPQALLAFYGPTNFTIMNPVHQTVERLKVLPPITPEIIKAAFFDGPRTFTIPNPAEFLSSPRSLLMLELFRKGGIGEFLAAGVTSGFELREAGSLPVDLINQISPSMLPLANYPPLFHIMGTDDQIFAVEQAISFAKKLQAAGVLTETLVVTDGQHGFDTIGMLDGEVHRHVMVPAINFICQFISEQEEHFVSRGVVTIQLPQDSFSMPSETSKV